MAVPPSIGSCAQPIDRRPTMPLYRLPAASCRVTTATAAAPAPAEAAEAAAGAVAAAAPAAATAARAAAEDAAVRRARRAPQGDPPQPPPPRPPPLRMPPMIPPRIAPARSLPPPAGGRAGPIPAREVLVARVNASPASLSARERVGHGLLRVRVTHCLCRGEQASASGEAGAGPALHAGAAGPDEVLGAVDLGAGRGEGRVQRGEEPRLLLRVGARRPRAARREPLRGRRGRPARDRAPVAGRPPRCGRCAAPPRPSSKSGVGRRRAVGALASGPRRARRGSRLRRRERVGEPGLGVVDGLRGRPDRVEKGGGPGDALLGGRRSRGPRRAASGGDGGVAAVDRGARAGDALGRPRRCCPSPRPTPAPRTWRRAPGASRSPPGRAAEASSWAGSEARIAGASRSRFRSLSMRAAWASRAAAARPQRSRMSWSMSSRVGGSSGSESSSRWRISNAPASSVLACARASRNGAASSGPNCASTKPISCWAARTRSSIAMSAAVRLARELARSGGPAPPPRARARARDEPDERRGRCRARGARCRRRRAGRAPFAGGSLGIGRAAARRAAWRQLAPSAGSSFVGSGCAPAPRRVASAVANDGAARSRRRAAPARGNSR